MTPRMCKNGLHDLTLPGAVLRYRDGRSRCRACRLANARRNQITELGRARRRRANETYFGTIRGILTRFAGQVHARSAAHRSQAEELGMDIER